MHTFLLQATPLASHGSPQGQGRPVFACVARGSLEAAEGAVLGELHRAGWKVLEVIDPGIIKRRFPALKRHPGIAQVMAAARERGMAFLVMEAEDVPGGMG